MTPNPSAPRTSRAAIAALVLGLLSCLCLPALPAVVFGIIGLIVTGRDPTLKGRAMANSGLALGVVCGFFAICALIALPDFLVDRMRSRQGACRAAMKQVSNFQRASMEESQRYTEDVPGAELPLTKSYRYLFSHKDLDALAPNEKDALPPWLINRVGVTGTCPDCNYLAACVGNLDGDAALDVWATSSAPLAGLHDFADAGEHRPIQLADDREDLPAQR